MSKFDHSPRLSVAERLHALVRLIRRPRQRWLLGIRLIRKLRQRWLLGVRLIRRPRQRWLLGVRLIRRLRQRWLLGTLRVRRCSWIGQRRFDRFVYVGSRVVENDMGSRGMGRGGSWRRSSDA